MSAPLKVFQNPPGQCGSGIIARRIGSLSAGVELHGTFNAL
jgi:hypothetical protein